MEQVDKPLTIYNNPANRFVFTFLGASNMLPCLVSDSRIYLKEAPEAGPIPGEIPAHLKDHSLILACRPSEIELTDTEGLKGIVKRKSFLGDIIDYRIRIGDANLRVEMNRRKGRFNEGDTCAVRFSRVFWYEGE